jgi:translation initiation factor 1 (eIF-1/SUI1)
MELTNIITETLFKDIEYPEQKPVITINDRIIATLQNFICLTGLPKSYKTTFAMHFIASGLLNRPVFDISVKINTNDKIILIDTETGIHEFSKQIKNLKRTLKTNILPANFTAYLFRKYDPDVIIASIEKIIIEQKPKILFIDNLTELVINPNDMIESKKIIQFLKKVTSEHNLVIVCLLHLGKSNPNNSLGNLGSYAARGCQSELKVSYDKETNLTTLEPVLMRSDLYFNPIQIFWDPEEKQFKQNLEVKAPKKSSRKFVLMDLTNDDHIKRLSVVFIDHKEIVYNELVEEIKKIYGIGTNIAKQQVIPYLLGNKFLFKDKGIYKFN